MYLLSTCLMVAPPEVFIKPAFRTWLLLHHVSIYEVYSFLPTAVIRFSFPASLPFSSIFLTNIIQKKRKKSHNKLNPKHPNNVGSAVDEDAGQQLRQGLCGVS